MEDRIEVGEYVRTKNGIIGKVKEVSSISCWIKKDFRISKRNIVKHGKQLIDVIEIGDVVNEHKVKAVYLEGATKYIKLDNAYKDGQGIRTYEEDIKIILTKEQID